jgi:hypothetical protein
VTEFVAFPCFADVVPEQGSGPYPECDLPAEHVGPHEARRKPRPALDVEPVRLRFGQEVILDCGPEWGGEQSLVVGWTERTESLVIGGQWMSSGASREYTLCDGLDAPSAEAIARVYGAAASTGG